MIALLARTAPAQKFNTLARGAAAPAGFPYFTGRERHELLLYQPRFRHPQGAALPPNLAEAEAIITPSFAKVLALSLTIFLGKVR